MKLNNKGFAISSIIYISLTLFLILIMALLAMMGSRKAILDKIRKDAYVGVNGTIGNNVDSDQPLDIAFPSLTDNMIPVVYSPTGIPLKADTKGGINNNWYNYKQSKWANVVLVKENGKKTREYYKTSAPGTIISSNDILAYFVWIPRYSYAVDSVNKKININFENKNVGVKSGTGKGEDYYTHPAFTFYDGFRYNKLNGIWVGKFASSKLDEEIPTGDPKITILPAKASLIMLSAKDMLVYSRQMELNNNIYGFLNNGTVLNTNGTIASDSNNFDTHVLKSLEYGALALLSQSQYGKNSEISPYYTGGIPYTGGGTGLEYLTDPNRSSTGNIYGVYDMVSPGGELVMGYRKTAAGVGSIYSINEIYFNKYDGTCIKGDATRSDNLTPWQTLDTTHYESIKDDHYYLRGKDSVFSYLPTSGAADSGVGFRVSLVIWE